MPLVATCAIANTGVGKAVVVVGGCVGGRDGYFGSALGTARGGYVCVPTCGWVSSGLILRSLR